MQHYKLTSEIRDIFGKKVKALRKSGMLPATVYGKDVKSVSLTVNEKEFLSLKDKAGETGLIDLVFKNESKPVLISNIQIHPVKGFIQHIEFHQVNLKEKVKANIPVKVVGVAPVVAQNLGVLLNINDEIEVEALPDKLPDSFEVNIEGLNAVDDEIKVNSIKAPSDVTIITEPDTVIVKIGALAKPDVEPVAPATSAEAGETSTAQGSEVKEDDNASDAKPTNASPKSQE